MKAQNAKPRIGVIDHGLKALAFFLVACSIGDVAIAAVDSFVGQNQNDNAETWINSVGAGWHAYAFEEDFPQPPDGDGCLSADDQVSISLPGGGTMLVRRSDGCPIVDGVTGSEIANARIPVGGSLRLTFLPPIRAFYSYLGSVALDTKVTLSLEDENGIGFSSFDSRPGPGGADSFGIGFTSKRLVSTIELTTSEVGGAAELGTFGGLRSGELALEELGVVCDAPGYPGALCDIAFAYDLNPVREIENDARVWDSMTIGANAYAFETDFPRPEPPPAALDCLSLPGMVNIQPSATQAVTLDRSSGECPVVAASSFSAADALIAQDQTLNLIFDPPVLGFYANYGSVNTGDTVIIKLADIDGHQVARLTSRLSNNNVDSIGHGFTSPTPIKSVQISSSETGPSVLGAFLGPADEVTLNDVYFRCVADESYADGALCDLALSSEAQMEQKLLASDAAGWDRFGVSVSIDGDRALIGADTDGNSTSEAPLNPPRENSPGRAYIFERSIGGQWLETATLTPDVPLSKELFGSATSIDGSRALVGAYGRDDGGAAYLFERQTSGEWLQLDRLMANDAALGDDFGQSVSLNGDFALISAPGEFSLGVEAGAAYVFRRESGGNWIQEAKLIPSDGKDGYQFGTTISLSGSYALVGDISEIYIFERSANGQWVELDQRLPGTTVSLDGLRALVGDVTKTVNGTYLGSGLAHIYERQADGQWTQEAVLSAKDLSTGLSFGSEVSLSGNQALISDDGFPDAAVYLFGRAENGVWTQISKMHDDGQTSSPRFGRSIALSDGRALIGAWRDGGRSNAKRSSGAAYLFDNILAADRAAVFTDGFEADDSP
jgi:hypothetical protein